MTEPRWIDTSGQRSFSTLQPSMISRTTIQTTPSKSASTADLPTELLLIGGPWHGTTWQSLPFQDVRTGDKLTIPLATAVKRRNLPNPLNKPLWVESCVYVIDTLAGQYIGVFLDFWRTGDWRGELAPGLEDGRDPAPLQ